MKNNVKINIATLLFAIISLALNAGNPPANENGSDPVMEVTGKISKKSKGSGLYKVELVYLNTIVDTKFVDDEMSFNFSLPQNRDYIIKIHKKGYATKSVSVNTGVSKYPNTKGYYKYEFIAAMEENISVKNLSGDAKVSQIDNPATDEQIGYLDLKRKYSKKVKPLVD